MSLKTTYITPKHVACLDKLYFCPMKKSRLDGYWFCLFLLIQRDVVCKKLVVVVIVVVVVVIVVWRKWT